MLLGARLFSSPKLQGGRLSHSCYPLVLLTSENEKLRVENQRQKKKRAEKRTYIARGGVLSGAEGASRAQAAQEGVVEGAAEAATERPQRAPRKCRKAK